MPPKRNDMSVAAIEKLIARHIVDALLDYEANRNSGNGNGNGNNNRNGNHDSRDGSQRPLHTACGCTYKEFLICQPLNFKGTEGDVGLAHWFKKMESVFHISNCTVECQVKYATCTLLGGALTWCNSYVRTVRHDAAYEMPWKNLMKMMTEAYCLRSETNKMVPEEYDKMERYVGGFPDSIQGNTMSARSKMLQDAIGLSNTRAYIARPSEKKEYAATLPLCNKSPAAANNQRTLTCFEYGNQWHYRSECPKLKNQNCGNQTGNGEARRRVYALGGGEADQDPNNFVDDVDA
ncbi:hypothetical protein Tco_1213663 [Tanacetum coccineum]